MQGIFIRNFIFISLILIGTSLANFAQSRSSTATIAPSSINNSAAQTNSSTKSLWPQLQDRMKQSKSVVWIKFRIDVDDPVFLSHSLLCLEGRIFVLEDLKGDYTYRVSELKSSDELDHWLSRRPPFGFATSLELSHDIVVEELPRLIAASQSNAVYNQVDFESLSARDVQIIETRRMSKAEQESLKWIRIREGVSLYAGGMVFWIASGVWSPKFFPWMSNVGPLAVFLPSAITWALLNETAPSFLGRRLKFHEQLLLIPVSAAITVGGIGMLGTCIGALQRLGDVAAI